jgi:23S rRNA pseudouridine1911/1915/1917 synthase
MLVELRLETGRTHQIRMHLSERGCPLLGDPLYGGRAAAETSLIARTALHAATLGFALPDGRRILLEAEPPADFAAALDALRAGRSWRG